MEGVEQERAMNESHPEYEKQDGEMLIGKCKI